MANSYRVGVDIGGTFTDIIFISNDGTVFTKKVLSTPDDWAKGIIAGIIGVIKDHNLNVSDISEVVHASTIVTNTCIELKGAKVGVITTKGFRDILEIGRGRVPVMYDLMYLKPPPLAPRYLRVEVDERINTQGEIIRPLDIQSVETVIDKLISLGVESVAVCLLNSPKNPIHEQKIGELLKQKASHVFVSLSTEITPLIGEYERTSETVVNAYVMPLVASYLKLLRRELGEAGVQAPIYVMESNGGMITPETASQRPVEIIECGPAAGVVGCAYIAKQQKINNIITFDMGGTTTKSSIVENGQYTRSQEYEVGGGIHRASRLLKGKGYVVRVPSIDIAEIGAGGGSILRVDVGGALHIGPDSAGSVPGPACYNLGGEEPTLTDVNVVLGYLNQDYLVGGELRLDAQKALAVVKEKVANPLGIDVIEAAYGAYCLANSNMQGAIRAVSSERGRDPQAFILYAFGGAGPMHAVGVAKGLNMKQVIVPPAPGVCSAFGLLCANIERHYVKSFSAPFGEEILEKLNTSFKEMMDIAFTSTEMWGGQKLLIPQMQKLIDLRYHGQSWELSIPVYNEKFGKVELFKTIAKFEAEHENTYGHRLSGYPIEVRALRLVAVIPSKGVSIRTITGGVGIVKACKKAVQTRKAYWGKQYGVINTPVFDFEEMGRGLIEGPVLVDCYDTTVVIPPKSTITKGDWGNLVINNNN